MRPFTLKKLFEKAGISIKYIWEICFQDAEVLQLNSEPRPIKRPLHCDEEIHAMESLVEDIGHLTNGYLIYTDCGHLEVRYGLRTIMIQLVNDYGFDTAVTKTRILPTPVHMGDEKAIVDALMLFKQNRFK